MTPSAFMIRVCQRIADAQGLAAWRANPALSEADLARTMAMVASDLEQALDQLSEEERAAWPLGVQVVADLARRLRSPAP